MSRFMDIWGPFLFLGCCLLMFPGIFLLLAPSPWWILGVVLFLPVGALLVGVLGAGVVSLWKDSMEEWKRKDGNEW